MENLTVDELKKIWVEDGTVKKWSDIRPGWPEEEIKLYSPGADSGTLITLMKSFLEDAPIVEKATFSEDDNVLLQGVTGDKNAIGYFGYAYYLENKDKLKVVPIDGGKGPVEPTIKQLNLENMHHFHVHCSYMLKIAAVKDQEAVYDFVKFTIENAGDLSEEVGYVKLPEENYTKQT